MKLYLGENIRNLRKKADLTQEQLAERLGVTYQSVSRWENGTSYPDLELIPAIAGVFSVSTDALLGIPELEKEERAKEAFDALRREIIKKDFDVNTINELIRDIRRNYLDSSSMWRFWGEGNQWRYCHPEILPEVRLTAEAFLDSSKDVWSKNLVIQTMATVENEEHLEEFMNRYVPELDISQNALKLDRYRFRKEWDKFDAVRKLNLHSIMDKVFEGKYYIDMQILNDPAENIKLARFQLETLNRFCGFEPDDKHPVSGNGQPDCWIEPRLFLGLRLAACYAALRDTEASFTALEDWLSLLESIMNIGDVTELSCASPWLKDFVWTAEPNWFNPYNNPDGKEEYNIWIHHESGSTYMIYPSIYYQMLTNPNGWCYDVIASPNGWKWLEPIQNDERYTQIVDRVKALIQYREKQ